MSSPIPLIKAANPFLLVSTRIPVWVHAKACILVYLEDSQPDNNDGSKVFSRSDDDRKQCKLAEMTFNIRTLKACYFIYARNAQMA